MLIPSMKHTSSPPATGTQKQDDSGRYPIPDSHPDKYLSGCLISLERSVHTIGIEDLLGYVFYDKDTLNRALTRKAYANEKKQRNCPCPDQEIFSTLGDAVLKAVLVDLLIRAGCSTPDEITQKKKELEREEILSRIAGDLGIGSFIHLGAGEEKHHADRQPYVLAETLEALIGAIFIDGGYEAAEQRIKRWFDPYLP
jgi:ribonuclease III